MEEILGSSAAEEHNLWSAWSRQSGVAFHSDACSWDRVFLVPRVVPQMCRPLLRAVTFSVGVAWMPHVVPVPGGWMLHVHEALCFGGLVTCTVMSCGLLRCRYDDESG